MSMFAKDKKTGELAVKKAFAFLKKAGYDPSIPTTPQKDHDIVIKGEKLVEVKFDVVMDSTGNLGVEWWSDKIERKEGWGQYCEADILIQFYNMDNAVVVDWHKFKRWLYGNMDQFERKDSKYSNADVVLVPMEQIPEFTKISEIGDLFSIDYKLEHWEIDAIRGKTYKIEPSKSGLAVCRACGERIQKHELRISDSGKWLHLTCAASEYIVSEVSLERLSGFDELTDWQAEHALKVVKQIENKENTIKK